MLLSCEKDISIDMDEAIDRLGRSSKVLEEALLFK